MPRERSPAVISWTVTSSTLRQKLPWLFSGTSSSPVNTIRRMAILNWSSKRNAAMKYPHDSLTINHRVVRIDDIRSSRVAAFDAFETSTFLFIRRWFSDENQFEIQTSGSTGPSKTISFTRDQMIASARMTEKALGLQPSYTALICLDTRFIAGQMMLVRCFTTGMAIQAVTPSSGPFAGLTAPVDFAALVPYQVYHTIETPESRFFNTTNTIIVGGAAIDRGAI